MPIKKNPTSESAEQIALFRMLRRAGIKAFSVPNGVPMSKVAAIRAVREGLTRGIPDLLIVDRPPLFVRVWKERLMTEYGLNAEQSEALCYNMAPCGVAIELKRVSLKPVKRRAIPIWEKDSKIKTKWSGAKPEQKLWLDNFNRVGWITAVCYGHSDARTLLNFLEYPNLLRR